MAIESLPLAHARAAQQVLSQYLVRCPACGKPGAAHVEINRGPQVRLVRFVCPDGCPIDVASVLAALPPDAEVSLTA
jgi:hypothetical protein